MRIPKILSIEQLREFSRDQREKPSDATQQKGSKITVLFFDHLRRSNSFGRSCLLPEVFVSRVMIDFLSSLAASMRKHHEDPEFKYSIKKKRHKAAHCGIPVGLHRNNLTNWELSKENPQNFCLDRSNLVISYGPRENKNHDVKPMPQKNRSSGVFDIDALSAYGWINAWAQFLIHLPRFTELVIYAEKIFEPVREFVDRYLLDQREGRVVSSAKSASLILPFLNSSSKRIDLYEVLPIFFKSIFSSMTNHLGTAFHDAIFFHPDWVISWDRESIPLFNDQLQNLINTYPSEIIISTKCREGSTHAGIQRQIFPAKGGCFYDLDSFIECRSDVGEFHYITYLRVDGAWYQCDDEKIRSISSRTLSAPLCRGVLFHYSRLNFY